MFHNSFLLMAQANYYVRYYFFHIMRFNAGIFLLSLTVDVDAGAVTSIYANAAATRIDPAEGPSEPNESNIPATAWSHLDLNFHSFSNPCESSNDKTITAGERVGSSTSESSQCWHTLDLDEPANRRAAETPAGALSSPQQDFTSLAGPTASAPHVGDDDPHCLIKIIRGMCRFCLCDTSGEPARPTSVGRDAFEGEDDGCGVFVSADDTDPPTVDAQGYYRRVQSFDQATEFELGWKKGAGFCFCRGQQDSSQDMSRSPPRYERTTRAMREISQLSKI